MMGFPIQLAKQAFKKSKTSVIGDVIDILVQMQADNPQPIQPLPVEPNQNVKKYKPYTCLQCTFYNENNPGPKCEICLADAPPTALIDDSAEKKAKAEAEAKQKALEEEAKEKERVEREAKEAERLAKAQKEEEERLAKV